MLRSVKLMVLVAPALLLAGVAAGQVVVPRWGPYNAEFVAGSDGLVKPAPDALADQPIRPSSWTLHAWVEPREIVAADAPLFQLGRSGPTLSLDRGRPALRADGAVLRAPAALRAGRLTHLAAVIDSGRARLMVNGRTVATGRVEPGAVEPEVRLAPRAGGINDPRFAGRLFGATAVAGVLSDAQILSLVARRPVPELVRTEEASSPWPIQTEQQLGQVTPQPAWTLPQPRQPFSPPVAKPLAVTPALAPVGVDRWQLGRWRMAGAPSVDAPGATLSRAGFDTGRWYAATVPGTVLTTLVDRGVYPDPDHGLNNLAIPERLARQDYWYRTEFKAPEVDGRNLRLVLNGVNYASEVWFNGERLGETRGAFTRAEFPLAGKLQRMNALAIRVSPPPHPGGAHEESLTSGPGQNGGMMALDGPTFIASEGWDWIPTVRDRNTGLWQAVELRADGPVRIGDTQVVTRLPRSDNSVAEVTLAAPLLNSRPVEVAGTLSVAIGDIRVERRVTVPAGGTTVRLSPAEHPQLVFRSPRLWWPNGYGEPTLHTAVIRFRPDSGAVSEKRERFGMREVSYDLSLFDEEGRLRRIRYTPGDAPGDHAVDVSHAGVRKVVASEGYAQAIYAASLTPSGERSAAIEPLAPALLAPHLLIRVNGVPIAVRGGNWGMDDWRKRVGRDRLLPYFRLHREANLNTIRNWMGQNSEPAFFELADEFGLMVVNDFWASTQDHQVEPQDVPLFLANARDTVRRYRNHPSIVLWLGRNEGVPQPVLNEGLDRLIREEDGTRFYLGNSRQVNMSSSGPWHYQPPETYFTTHARGFSTEIGTPSFPTLEAFRAMMPESERWPISDAWAYYDWHQDKGGDTRPFVQAMEARFGSAMSLEDFERKAQMLNYESHRAIFEGMNAELFTVNSGRLLWMSQPAWPSTVWQTHSHDYDTHASFYGARKGAEPIHVQLNMPDNRVAVVNSPPAPFKGSVRARIMALDGRMLHDRRRPVSVGGAAVNTLDALPLPSLFAKEGAVLVALELLREDGGIVSENRYLRTRDDLASRQLNRLPAVPLLVAAKVEPGSEAGVRFRVENRSASPALMIKLTLLDANGRRVLPAYYSDNYVTLLPGEARELVVRTPQASDDRTLAVRGWNVVNSAVQVTGT